MKLQDLMSNIDRQKKDIKETKWKLKEEEELVEDLKQKADQFEKEARAAEARAKANDQSIDHICEW